MSNKNRTLKSIRQAFGTGSADFNAMAHEQAEKQAEKLEITDKSSRREQYGVAGMRFDTHSRTSAYLSGLSDNAAKVFNQFDRDPELLVKLPEAGGLSREHKLFTLTVCEAIAQGKRPGDLELGHVVEAARKLDPKFPAKRNGHNSINYLIDTLKEKGSFSALYWEANCNGPTQAAYMLGWLKKMGLATVSGSKAARTANVKNDHPIVMALIELADQ